MSEIVIRITEKSDHLVIDIDGGETLHHPLLNSETREDEIATLVEEFSKLGKVRLKRRR